MNDSILLRQNVAFGPGAFVLLMFRRGLRQTARVEQISRSEQHALPGPGKRISAFHDPWWHTQHLVEAGNWLERIKFGFEVQDGMAATWKVGFYLVASLSAYVVLLFGLFALSADPIAGVLFTIGGMAVLLYGLAGLCGAPLFKN
jgi:hypothetical protein